MRLSLRPLTLSDEARFRAVIFDLDGTLLHSVPSLTRVLNALFAEEGLAPLDEAQVCAMVGEGAGLLVARAYGARAVGSGTPEDPGHSGRVARFMACYGADPVSGATLYPGAAETLQHMAGRGVRLGLCTNKPEGPTRALLEAFALAPLLGAVIAGDTLPWRKPDPRPLLATLERLDVPPGEVLFVGDSAIDVACARNAGVPVVVLAHGYRQGPVEALGADRAFQGFDDLMPWLAKVAPGDRA
ncbi:phosphoglycolate phosphatase [Pararhodospirillum photometricum]|uniref:phosphoglycolate phosphatase n=1 Tax=Pararhodospirillum photometricum TaxID=1084 RepID=UPI00030797DF|nr:phosphoglycolate phosphatase [Pararhodospirillum photometricum]